MKNNMNSGFSLIEIVIAVGIIAGVFVGHIGANRLISNMTSKSESSTTLQKNLVNLVESISSNVGYYQVNFSDPTLFTNLNSKEVLMEKLPLAWSKTQIARREDCEYCKGRMGFSISPLPGEYRGLYNLRIKIIHPELANGEPQDFLYLIKGR